MKVLTSYLGITTLVVLGQVSNVFDYEFDKVLIARYVGASDAGLYDVGSALALGARGVAVLPLLVLVPGIAELFERSPARARTLFMAIQRVTGLGVLTLLGGVYIFGPAAVHVWIGPGHEAAGMVAQWIAAALAINVVAAPAAYYAIARRWTKVVALGSLVNIVINSVASLVLTQHLGLRGALIGSLAANVAATIVFLVVVARRDPDLSIAWWLRPGMASVAAVVIALLAGLGDSTPTVPGLLLRLLIWALIALLFAGVGGLIRDVRAHLFRRAMRG
jgi:O-antigen/teichoic acid export membrane protein